MLCRKVKCATRPALLLFRLSFPSLMVPLVHFFMEPYIRTEPIPPSQKKKTKQKSPPKLSSIGVLQHQVYRVLKKGNKSDEAVCCEQRGTAVVPRHVPGGTQMPQLGCRQEDDERCHSLVNEGVIELHCMARLIECRCAEESGVATQGGGACRGWLILRMMNHWSLGFCLCFCVFEFGLTG